MKITVKEIKCGEALSPKMQQRLKIKELDAYIQSLPFFGDIIGDSLQALRQDGFGYGVGNAEKEEQEKAAKDILSDFDDYLDYAIKQEDDDWYIAITFKPSLWALSLEDAKKVFKMLDDAFGPYCQNNVLSADLP